MPVELLSGRERIIRSHPRPLSGKPGVVHSWPLGTPIFAVSGDARRMNYFQILQSEGGLVRSSRLVELGISRYYQRRLIAQGHLLHPAMGWVALPGVDADQVFAVEHGVFITCMTLAARYGLWTRRASGLHVAAREAHAHQRRVGAVTHWGKPVVRRNPHSVLDPIENALAYIADCQPREEAFAVRESALRKDLVTKSSLERLRLRPAARQILAECTPYSDSGLESIVARRLRSMWLDVKQQIWILGHRVDLLIDGWLVIQIDGGHHVDAQRDSDNRHDALLNANGFVVIRLSYRQVLDEWPESQYIIMSCLSQGKPRVR